MSNTFSVVSVQNNSETNSHGNAYIPFRSRILEVLKHTEIEYTFRMSYDGPVLPGQFFEVSLPKFGEAPISVSGIAPGSIDLTIRKVGRVTGEIFESYAGQSLMLRGPYGNGFDLNLYRGRELLVVAGGTGLSPVRALVDHFAVHRDEVADFSLITGFKSTKDILFLQDIVRWSEKSNVILTVDCADDDVFCNIGLVTEYIPKVRFRDPANASCIVVGPPMMMKFAVKSIQDEHGIADENIWVSYERKMCCGIGKCGHCKMDDTYICLDGPVFNYSKAKTLKD